MNINSAGGYSTSLSWGAGNESGQTSTDFTSSLYKQIQEAQAGGSDNPGKNLEQEADESQQSLVDKARDTWLSKLKSEEEADEEELQQDKLAETQQTSKSEEVQLQQRKLLVEEELTRQKLFMSANEGMEPGFNEHLLKPNAEPVLSV